MIARTYLMVASIVYLSLAIWCVVSPSYTSEKVGLELQGGSGQSEFLTVYGGLEFGIALVLGLACLRNGTVNYGVLVSVLLHGSLVCFRTIGFFSFSDIGPFTYRLAIGEWLVLILGILVLQFAPVAD